MDITSLVLGKKYTDEKTKVVADELVLHKEDYTNQRQQDQLKVAKVEKDINDYQSTMATINPNQEVKQKVSGYGTVSLPKTTANGQVSSIQIKGRTLKSELNYNRDTWAEWTKSVRNTISNQELIFTSNGVNNTQATLSTDFKTSTKYGFLVHVSQKDVSHFELDVGNSIGSGGFYKNLSIGNNKVIGTTPSSITANRVILYTGVFTSGLICKAKDIRAFELPTGSEIENDFNIMTADQLAIKYPYIKGDSAKSTISASRLKSVGKNLFDGSNAKPRNQVGEVSWNNGVLTYRRTNVNSYSGALIKVKLKKGATYRLNYTDNPVDGAYYKQLLDSNLTFVSWIHGKATFTAIEENMYILFTRAVDNTSGVTVSNIQLEEGTTSTPYEPYIGSISYLPNVGELRSLPNGTRDEIRSVK